MYIVVPHYIITEELKELATQALKSLKAFTKVYIVSVDDGSPMDTTFLDEYSDYVVRLKKNSGFGPACNAGFRHIINKHGDRAAFIGCANNDIEVFYDWADSLLEPYGKFDDVGVTGLVSDKNRDVAKYRKGRKITSGGLLDSYMQSGGLWLMSRRSFDTVWDYKLGRLFDEQFEIGGEEDVDLFVRIRQQGFRLVMSDKSCFWHKEGATRWNEDIEGFRDKNKAIEEKNYDKYAKKWGYDIRARGLNFSEEVLEP